MIRVITILIACVSFTSVIGCAQRTASRFPVEAREAAEFDSTTLQLLNRFHLYLRVYCRRHSLELKYLGRLGEGGLEGLIVLNEDPDLYLSWQVANLELGDRTGFLSHITVHIIGSGSTANNYSCVVDKKRVYFEVRGPNDVNSAEGLIAKDITVSRFGSAFAKFIEEFTDRINNGEEKDEGLNGTA